jgi:hypothetical protein
VRCLILAANKGRACPGNMSCALLPFGQAVSRHSITKTTLKRFAS